MKAPVTYKDFVNRIAAPTTQNAVSAADTARAVANVPRDVRADKLLYNLARSGIRDVHSVHHEPEDQQALPDMTDRSLPKVITKDLINGVNVKWFMVRRLPGYMVSGIRAIGRQVFTPFTKTPIEDIQVISSLTNKESELLAIGGFLKHYAVRDREYETLVTMKFNQHMPGYQADMHVYRASGYMFIVVVDFMGQYIYGWPEADLR